MTSGEKARGLAFAGCILLAILVRIPWLGGPYSRDECAAMTVAREMQAGHLPNTTLWQQRHPGTYLFYAAALVVPVSPDHQLDLLAALCVAATTAAVAAWLSLLFPFRWAAPGTLLYALMSADVAIQGQSANTELLMNPLLAASAWLTVRFRRSGGTWALVAAGATAGLASTVKEHAAFFILAMALVILADGDPRRERIRRAALFAGGAAIPWVLLLAVYAAAGNLEVVLQTFVFNAGHMRLPRKGFTQFVASQAWCFYAIWPVVLLSAGSLAARAARRRIDGTVTAYLLAAGAMVAAPGWFFPHYYILALPALAAGAVAILCLISVRSPRVAALLAAGCIAYASLTQVLYSTGPRPPAVERMVRPDPVADAQREFARALGARFRGRTLCLYGQDHQFFFYSGMRPAQRVLWLDFYDRKRFAFDSRAAFFRDWTLEGLGQTPPDVIVFQADVESRRRAPVGAFLRELVSRGYRQVPAAEVAPSMPVWRLARLGVREIHVRERN